MVHNRRSFGIRTINGHEYHRGNYHWKKELAQKEAKTIRKEGGNAVVIPRRTPFGKYQVFYGYHHKGKR